MNLKHTAKKIAKHALWLLAPGLFRKMVKPRNGTAEFAIGIYSGESPWTVAPCPKVTNPVLTKKHVTDAPAAAVADPFIVRRDGTFFMFFETVNLLTRKGEIAFATSRDGLHWSYRKIVLAEPYHLSYPYVFSWNGGFYMIPEGARSGAVVLYKATKFPHKWSRIAEILQGGRFVDNSIFHYRGMWYLFTDNGPEPNSPMLRLFLAEDLQGPWTEHPASPIIDDNPHISRPSGRVLVTDDKLIRFTQDVYPIYGASVRAFEIIELTPTTYQERPIGIEPVLDAGQAAWNNGGMHHIDAHKMDDGSWMACVDGFHYRNSQY